MKSYKKHLDFTSNLIRFAGNKIGSSDKGEGRLCILTYHRILECFDPFLESEPDINTFRWQMELLANCFNVLPLHDAVTALTTKNIPPRAVCITFDDGYRSIHDFALPILKEFNLTATVFVTSGYVDKGSMWNDMIIEAVRVLPNSPLDLQEVGLGTYTLDTLEDKKRTIYQLTETAKYLPPESRLVLLHKLEDLVGGIEARRLMLSSEMIWQLARENIEIGGHTISHPILTSVDDKSAYKEILGCKQQLEKITGKPARLFAYPNGKAGKDFDMRHVQMAKEAGFTAAFTTAMGSATSKHDFYQLPRSRPWDSTPFFFGLRLLHWLSSDSLAKIN